MPDIKGTTIVAVTLNPTRNGKQRWDVQLSTGEKASCFDVEKMAKASQFLNVAGSDVRVSQKDQYLNFQDVAAAGQLPGAVEQAPQVQASSPSSNGTSKGYGYQTNPIDAERMGKANAISTAFTYAGATGQDEAYAWDLATKIFKAVTETSEPVHTPESIAQQLSQVKW